MKYTRVGLLLLLSTPGVLSLGVPLQAAQQGRFRSDDPIRVDPDRESVPKPAEKRLSQIYDFVESSFITRPRKEPILEAENINTLGEVPDSSWFTNRMSRKIMSLEELVRGPNRSAGPDRSQPWTVIAAKTEGVTPGFTIRDGRGDVYFIKFDPIDHPQLATSTEVIATKFFYSFGYHVPENYLTYVRRAELEISDDAKLTDQEGKKRSLVQRDLDRIFRRVYVRDDGTVPAIASKAVPGEPIGPFKYSGTRADDPNDIFPHENRRELRGLRLFAAWTNHDDSRSINTLDMYAGEPGKGHVRHYLIDFGSCFGSGSIKVQSKRAGNEYMIERKPILKAALTLGIWDRPWRKVKYPNYPGIGRFEGDFFQPHLWRPEYPSPAFDRMLPADALWAVRIIGRYSDEMIEALVATGEFTDLGSAEYLSATLIKRRDKILHHYLGQMLALDNFRVREQKIGAREILFDDLRLQASLPASSTYRYNWFAFHNPEAELTLLESSGQASTGGGVPVPRHQSEFLMVRLSDATGGIAGNVDVYLRNEATGPTIVGIERQFE